MKGGQGSRSAAPPCAACKFLKRRCIPSCVFAPYFKAEEPQKFANVHRIFGASNVSKLLREVPLELRPDAVTTLAYEAEARLRDPVYGCVGDLSLLHWKMVKLQEDLANARVRLARYVAGSSLSSAASSLSAASFPFYEDAAVAPDEMGFCGSSFFPSADFQQQ